MTDYDKFHKEQIKLLKKYDIVGFLVFGQFEQNNNTKIKIIGSKLEITKIVEIMKFLLNENIELNPEKVLNTFEEDNKTGFIKNGNKKK